MFTNHLDSCYTTGMVDIDIRIRKAEPLVSPEEMKEKYPLTGDIAASIIASRSHVNDIIRGSDKRLLAIVGPCSIHDPVAALDYAGRLKSLSEKISAKMYVVMRTYFEKPRTVLGWKGLILDPDMDGSYDIARGIALARSLLVKLTRLGLPLGCEVLDPIIPQYIDDLMSWSSIGARTTESQTHRNLASGLSVAVGFKNNTNGDVATAVNAIRCARNPAAFIGIDRKGMSSIFRTTGNDCCHLILRGGEDSPNYYEDDVEAAARLMASSSLHPAIIIDCSHGNSRKDCKRQSRVLRSVVDQVCWGEESIKGFMLESNIKEGKQELLGDPSALEYGKSVTDSCIGWEETEELLMKTYERLKSGKSSPL